MCPAFEKFAEVYCGHDEYIDSIGTEGESVMGGYFRSGSEPMHDT
jgi:hypothetical protein